MNHLPTSIERCKQTATKPAHHPQPINLKMDDIVLDYQRIKKLNQEVKENRMTVPLSEHQIRFVHLFESQCEQLKKEVTSDGFTAFKLHYLEIPRKRKTYVEIASLAHYKNESGPRKIVKRVRSKFLKRLVESGLEALYLKEIATQHQSRELSVSDILQAYERVKKNSKCICCRSKSKKGGGARTIFDN